MSARKPSSVVLYLLTALAVAPLLLLLLAAAASQFGGVDLAITYDLVAWKILQPLSWVGLAAGLGAVVLAVRDLKRRAVWALVAVVASGALVGGYLTRAKALAVASPLDITTDLAEPPALPGVTSIPQGQDACAGARVIPTQMLAEQVTEVLVDQGFVITRAATFAARGYSESLWFGFRTEVSVRIRPGRTDVRLVAVDGRPDAGATCQSMERLVAALEARAAG